MEELQIFKSPVFGTVRAMEISGEPYFVGKDVAEALGYSNPNEALQDHVDDEDKLNSKTLTSLGQRGGWLISESGVYSLVFASKLPKAKEFKRWVTSEVLPSIRKHGAYLTPKTLHEMLVSPEGVEQLLLELKEEQEKRRALENENEAMRPAQVFADAVSTSKTSILVGDLAKVLKGNGIDIGQKRLFDWLRTHGYLIRGNSSSRNMPTQRAMELGLFEIKESSFIDGSGASHITRTVKVTGKGQIYFVNKFLGEKK